MVKNANKTLNGLIVFIRRLSFQLSDKRWLLETGSIKNVALPARESSGEDPVEPLTVERSWARRRGVGRQGRHVMTQEGRLKNMNVCTTQSLGNMKRGGSRTRRFAPHNSAFLEVPPLFVLLEYGLGVL